MSERSSEASETFAAPVSFAQERLWFLERLEPGLPTYNIPMPITVEGWLNRDLVAGVLDDLVRRHETFRTTFRVLDGVPMQVVAPHSVVPLDEIDLSGLPERERRAEAKRLADQVTRKPFDLSSGPLFRALLVRLSEHHHQVLLTMHHVVADLWSTTVLLRDFNALLQARRQGTTAELPALPIQYADFAEWQRGKLRGPSLQRLESYWTGVLAGVPAEVTFPLDHPRGPAQSFAGQRLMFTVPHDVVTDLTRIGRDQGATLFMTLLAAFEIVLGQSAGLDDVVVGTPIANRTRPEVENLIGFFSNTLVLRTRLDPDRTFRDLVDVVKAVTLGAYEHQDLPFEHLVATLATDRQMSLPPLFQVLFGLQTTQRQDQEPQPLALEGDDIDTGTAKFDATVLLIETASGLLGGFEYCTDLYEPDTISAIVDAYCTCLRAVVANPDAPVREIARAAFRASRAQALELAATSRNESVEPTVLTRFDAQVLQAPDATAVVAGERSLSFAELDALATVIALVLRSEGVGRGDRVGICLPSDLSLPAAVLAVLRCGAAYVPLDPSYPAERLAFMSEDAGLAATLVREVTVGALPENAAHLVPLDGLLDAPPGPATRHRWPRLAAEDLAYVIYTSGSTGRPKGVAMPHGVLANLVAWQIDTSAPALRTLQLAPLSFDVSFQELFTTWCAGAAVVLCEAALRADPRRLLAHARHHGAERIFLPPALLQLLADASGPRDWPPSLREVVTAGEALRITPPVHRALARLPGLVVRNQYGPSETHVVTEHRMVAGGFRELPPIGRPITNAAVYVLDGVMEPVPVGARGELYLGGPVLAQGYLGRPELTAERFVPDPFGAVPGGRLYRTGDVVRFGAGGALQFLGRADDQLKVRGFRVEPGEVETQLEQLEGVRAAAVVGVTGGAGGTLSLVAFVEVDGGARPGAELRQLLAARLPKWMVPDRVSVVEALPLTPSGKVDRRALSRRLPAIDVAVEELDDGPTAPRTDLELALCAIWSEVLEVGAVGVRESFFDLGGHSIAVARVAARLAERLDVELPLRVLFDATTVEDLARAVVVHRLLATDPQTVDALFGELDDKRADRVEVAP